MNEIARISTPTRTLIPGVHAALNSKTAHVAQHLAVEMQSVASRDFEDDRALRDAEYQRVAALAEAFVQSPEYKKLCETLKLATEPATLTQIKKEIAGLIACFPSQADVALFIAFAVEEIACNELPTSFYALAAGCRGLRRTKVFRPAIAEILNAVFDEEIRIRHKFEHLAQLPARLARLKAIASEAAKAKEGNAP
jgi:hypothetical protein